MVLTGRAVINRKYCVEECAKIDLKDFRPYMDKDIENQKFSIYDEYGNETRYIVKNLDKVDPGKDDFKVILQYSIKINATGKIEKMSYYVRLTRTKCNYGGYRWWFLCPNHICQRRVRVLYRSPASKYFACRHCHRLTYRSRQEHRSLMDKLFKLAQFYEDNKGQ